MRSASSPAALSVSCGECGRPRITCAECGEAAPLCACLVSRRLVEKAMRLVDQLLTGRTLTPDLADRFAAWRAEAAQEDTEWAGLEQAPRRLQETVQRLVATEEWCGPAEEVATAAQIKAAKRWIAAGGLGRGGA